MKDRKVYKLDVYNKISDYLKRNNIKTLQFVNINELTRTFKVSHTLATRYTKMILEEMNKNDINGKGK